MDLDRFVDAQAGTYDRALGELRAGRKTSHWMWWIFPQVAGLGMSATSKAYAIADPTDGTFRAVLDRYHDGTEDERTITLLA